MKKLFILILLIVCKLLNATTYYVASGGNNGSAGTSQATAWATLIYAAGNSSPVTAGDIVYVAAGSYTGTVTFSKSGSLGKPISYIGYTATPGDQPTVLVNNSNPYAAYSSTVMPTFTGSARGNGVAGFDMTGAQYLVIKNFQIQQYSYGVFMGDNPMKGNNTLYNVNCMALGDVSSYDGYGITLGSMSEKFSNYNKVTDCLIVNANAEGITICGDYNCFSGCKVYCNENASQTDYYITIVGSFNTVYNCYSNQAAGLGTGSHGNSFKSNAEQIVDNGLSYAPINPMYNLMAYCTVVGVSEGFSFRHRNCKYNMVYKCRAIGRHLGTDATEGDGNGCIFRDGASNNIVDALYADSVRSGIEFDDTGEDGGATGHPGNYNIVRNSTFANVHSVIKFSSDGGVASDAGDNLIANCSFYLGRYFLYAARRCTTMRYDKCIFYGNSAVGSGGYFRGNTYSSDVVSSQFTDCSFYNIQGGLPGGWSSTGQITTDPKYTNPGSRNFTLQATSPCIDAGTHMPTETVNDIPICRLSFPGDNINWLEYSKNNARVYPHITRDFNYVTRPKGSYIDIGAYEY